MNEENIGLMPRLNQFILKTSRDEVAVWRGIPETEFRSDLTNYIRVPGLVRLI